MTRRMGTRGRGAARVGPLRVVFCRMVTPKSTRSRAADARGGVAADAVIEECHIGRAEAIEILRVQERSFGFREQRRRRPAVVGAYYAPCRPGLIVQVLRRTRVAPLRRLARTHGVAKWTRFQRVRFTHRQTYRAQRVIDARLEPLFERCLVSTYQDTPGNGVGLELSNDATPADIALVREAIGLTKVPVACSERRVRWRVRSDYRNELAKQPGHVRLPRHLATSR